MKKLIAAATVLTIIALPISVSAKAYKLPKSYRATYCYDGGSYWTAQKASYPDYYAENNAYYEAAYGAGTMYCPVN